MAVVVCMTSVTFVLWKLVGAACNSRSCSDNGAFVVRRCGVCRFIRAKMCYFLRQVGVQVYMPGSVSAVLDGGCYEVVHCREAAQGNMKVCVYEARGAHGYNS